MSAGVLELRCYCCGSKITGSAVLAAYGPGAVDRAFVLLPDHAENVADDLKCLLVSTAVSP